MSNSRGSRTGPPLIALQRVAESALVLGTGPIVLSGTSAPGFRAFINVMADGDTCYYDISSPILTEWEHGLGSWHADNTFTRDVVTESSNANSLVDFTGAICALSMSVNPSGGSGGLAPVTSVAHKVGDVLLWSTDLEDWDNLIIDGGNF